MCLAGNRNTVVPLNQNPLIIVHLNSLSDSLSVFFAPALERRRDSRTEQPSMAGWLDGLVDGGSLRLTVCAGSEI